MRFTIIIRVNDPDDWDETDEATVKRYYDQHHAFDAAVAQRGTLIAGSALAPTGVTLSGPQRTVTEGPYAESVEQISGVYIIDVESRDVAIELARMLPEAYDLEIRDPTVLEGY